MRRSTVLIVLLTVLALSALDLPASDPEGVQLTPLGPDFQVSTEGFVEDYPDRRIFPEVTVGDGGEFVVVWAEYPLLRQARSFSAAGTPGGEFTVDTGVLFRSPVFGSSMTPVVDGEFVLAWSENSYNDTPQVKAAVAQRFSVDGSPIGERIIVSEGERTWTFGTTVAHHGPGGDFVVVWNGYDYDFDSGPPSETPTWARFFDSGGVPTGGPFVIDDDQVALRSPSVASSPQGGFLVVWDKGSGTGIVGRRYDVGGQALTEAFTINPVGNSSEVVTTMDGGFVVVWRVRDGDIYGRVLASDASLIGPDFQINTYTTGLQIHPVIAVAPSGEAVVAWSSQGSSGSDNDSWSIQARLLAADGSFLGHEFQVNTLTRGQQGGEWLAPDVSVGRSGDVVIVWGHQGSGVPWDIEASIRGRRFKIREVPEPPCDEPHVLCLGPGGRFQVRVEWQDFDGDTGLGREIFGPTETPDSGLFYFFDPDNWELLIKVLDGCGTNGHYWVFSAATTNVGYTVTVTDTLAELERVYTNPLGTAAPAVTDVRAFANCE